MEACSTPPAFLHAGRPRPLTVPDSRELQQQTCGRRKTHGYHQHGGSPGKQLRYPCLPTFKGHYDLSYQEDLGQDASPPPTCFLLCKRIAANTCLVSPKR